MTMIYHSKIISISDIITDNHGYFYVDLELENGIKGYYPNSEEFLKSLSIGAEVSYISMEEFNKRLKIKGLILKNKIMSNDKVITIITKTSPIIKSEKGVYYKDITTDDNITASFFSKDSKEIEQLITGSLISYTDIKTIKDKDWFVGLEKLKKYSFDELRNISIIRQSSIKAAIECYNIGSPKGRWIDKDGSFLVDECYKDVLKLAEKFVDYSKVE